MAERLTFDIVDPGEARAAGCPPPSGSRRQACHRPLRRSSQRATSNTIVSSVLRVSFEGRPTVTSRLLRVGRRSQPVFAASPKAHAKHPPGP
jgi:hypothetical protein